MTDRADEKRIWKFRDDNGWPWCAECDFDGDDQPCPECARMVRIFAEFVRAYGDERHKQGRAVGLRESTNYGEGRLAGLEEAAALESLNSGQVAAILALKEKP